MRKLVFVAIAAMALVSVNNIFASESYITSNAMPADTTQTDTTVVPSQTKMYLQTDTTASPADTTATPTDTTIAK